MRVDAIGADGGLYSPSALSGLSRIKPGDTVDPVRAAQRRPEEENSASAAALPPREPIGPARRPKEPGLGDAVDIYA